MSMEFKSYRRFAFRAIRDLLCTYDRETVNQFLMRAKATKTEAQLSSVMADVRKIL